MRVARRARSPWLAPIEAAASAGRSPTPRAGTASAAIAEARGHLNGLSAVGAEPEPDVELLGALVEWRRNLARLSGVPAYVIFHDKTLRAVAAVRPCTRDDLLAVPGIGPVKVERHADAVLELVRRHAS
jgi:superfamily II DNA helicase RecQ